MSDSFLSLGPISFKRLEVPEQITFGGRQRLVTHRLADSSRIVDSLGPDEADIRFGGIISGTHAATRAQQLDMLRAMGVTLTLRWDSFLYLVIIKSFAANYHSTNWIPYSVTCSVVSDQNNPAPIGEPSLGACVTSDLEAISDLGPIDGVDWTAITQIASSGAIVGSSGPDRYTAVACTTDLLNRLTPLANAADAALSTLAKEPPTCAQLPNVLADSAINTQLAWSIAIARGYVGRMRTNLMCDGGQN